MQVNKGKRVKRQKTTHEISNTMRCVSIQFGRNDGGNGCRLVKNSQDSILYSQGITLYCIVKLLPFKCKIICKEASEYLSILTLNVGSVVNFYILYIFLCFP